MSGAGEQAPDGPPPHAPEDGPPPLTAHGRPPRPPTGPAHSPDGGRSAPSEPAGGRPLIERLGLGAIALLLAAVFGALAYAATASGELFLGVMAGIGALMTVWAAASTLRRG